LKVVEKDNFIEGFLKKVWKTMNIMLGVELWSNLGILTIKQNNSY
jgi:hypothetical protein